MTELNPSLSLSAGETAGQDEIPVRTGSEKPETRKGRRGMARIAFWIAAVFTILLFIRPNEIIEDWAVSGLHRIFGIAAIVAALLSARGRLTGLFKDRLFRYFLLFLFAILLSVPFGYWPGGSYDFLSETFVKQVSIMIVLLIVLRDDKQVAMLARLIVFCSVIVSIYAITVFLGGERLVEGYRAGLSQGSFKDPNDLALHLVFSVPLAYFLLLRRARRKLLPLAVIVTICAALAVTLSRGGYIGLAACLTAILFLDRRHRKRNLVFVMAGLFAVVVAFPAAVDRLATITQYEEKPEESMMGRIAILKNGISIFLQNPLLGVGVRCFSISEGEMHGGRGAWRDAHNSFIQVAAETGILGLIGYTGCLVLILAARKPDGTAEPFSEVRAGIQASAVGYAACALFLSQAYSWYFFYLLGITLARRRMSGG